MLKSKLVGDQNEGTSGESGHKKSFVQAKTQTLVKVLKQMPEQDVHPLVWVLSDVSGVSDNRCKYLVLPS